MRTETDAIAMTRFLEACLCEDEAVARAASGSTVVGVPGDWQPAPGGDEWEPTDSDGYEELLVALRPGLARPPDVMGGYWGAIAGRDVGDREGSAMPCFIHVARWGPARMLAQVEAVRAVLRALSRIDEISLDANVWTLDEPVKTALRALLAPYGDRPGFKPQWRADE